MPRTRNKPKPQPPAAGEVLTLAEAAAYLRVPEAEVVAAVTAQGLPARRMGGEWRFSRSGIERWLSVSQPTAETRKAAQLAVAGVFKDDPDLFPILEDAMRRRGREPGPDGTYGGYRPAEGNG